MEINLPVWRCRPQRPHQQAGHRECKGKGTITETSHFKRNNSKVLICVPDKLSIYYTGPVYLDTDVLGVCA